MRLLRSFVLWFFGVMTFLILGSFLAISLLFFPPRRLYPMVRIICRLILRAMGIQVTVHGVDRFDPGRTCVLMANHESLFDMFVIPVAVPMYLTAVEAAYHFKIPLWGFLVRSWGCIPVHREDINQARKDLARAAEIIAGGVSIVILPEGHRTEDGKIGEFKKGPFHLAKTAGVDILPFSFSGVYEIKPKKGWYLNPGRVVVTFGEPVPAETVKVTEVDNLRERVRQRIIDTKKEGDKIRATYQPVSSII